VVLLTFSSLCELALLIRQLPGLNLASILAQSAALLLFLMAVMRCVAGAERRLWSPVSILGLALAVIYYFERSGARQVSALHWETAIFEAAICLFAGWKLWRSEMAAAVTGRSS